MTRESATGIGERVCHRSYGSCGNIICCLAESSLAYVGGQVSCVRGEWKGHGMYIGCWV